MPATSKKNSSFPIVYHVKDLSDHLVDTKNAIIFIDIDDTIITPKSKSFRITPPEINLIDEIKRDKALYPNFSGILSSWRLARKTILVDEDWPQYIKQLKNAYQVLGLTKMEHGEFGNIPSMEKWRYNELATLNIEFSILQNINNQITDAPSYYNGIFITGPMTKSQTIARYLSALQPSQITFIDDRIEQLNDVAEFCNNQNIPFNGILFRRVDKLPKQIDPRIKQLQKLYLTQHNRWLEDEEAQHLFSSIKHYTQP